MASVPPDAKAVALNLTATEANGAGFLTAWPTGQTAAADVEPQRVDRR